MKKKLSFVLSGLFLIGILSGCSGLNEGNMQMMTFPEYTGGMGADDIANVEADIIKIGVVQSGESSRQSDIYTGFMTELESAGYKHGDNIYVEYSIASVDNECAYAVDRAVTGSYDMILAIGGQAARAALNRTREIPVIVSDVEDLEKAGFVKTNEAPGGNASGVSSIIEETVQADLIKLLYPEAVHVTVLYSDSVDSRIKASEFVDGCRKKGIKTTLIQVMSSDEIRNALLACIKDTDAVYCPSDEIVFSNMADAAGVCNDNEVPFFCSSVDMVTYGGLASCTIEYQSIGKYAADMAVRLIEEKVSIASIPVSYLAIEDVHVNVNKTTAELVKAEIPSELAE